MKTVYIGGKRVSLDQKDMIGSGGEAEIFSLSNGQVLKLFKQPDHVDFEGQAELQRAVADRLREHQRKLYEFPKNLPSGLVAPSEVATDRSGQVLGYTMRKLTGMNELIRYTDQNFRKGVKVESVRKIFRDLHVLVDGIHKSGAVIGDFNDLNVMVGGGVALIDADSIQFGSYLCRLFTERFVDPMICDPNAEHPTLMRPYSGNSDWYAYTVMLMQILLYVGPYGGIYRPKDKRRQVSPGLRPLRRITVFNPEVQYPKPAVPYKVLPDDLLHQFHLVFEKDERGMFPLRFIESLRWTTCGRCGLVHLRSACPVCDKNAPEAVKETLTVRGSVKVKRVFATKGHILEATVERGTLRWLVHENDRYIRENGTVVLEGELDPGFTFRLLENATVVAKDGRLVRLAASEPPMQLSVDSWKHLPTFDANAEHLYWSSGGQVFRDEPLGPEFVGDVLAGNTLFWVGPDFGLGFYKAGGLCVGFTFDVNHRGLNDSVKMPRLNGQLIDAYCVFGSDLGWLFTKSQESGRMVNRCFLIDRKGTVLATAEGKSGDGSWLSSIRGATAAGKFLLVATDNGLERVELDGSTIRVVKTFPDTEPFVEEGVKLLIGKSGVYVVTNREIVELRIS